MTASINSPLLKKPLLLSLGLIASLGLSACVPNNTVHNETPAKASVLSSQTHGNLNSSANKNFTNKTTTNEPPIADVTPEHPAQDIAQAVKENHFEPILWNAMADNFALSKQFMGQYDDYIEFFENRKKHINQVSKRAEPYLYHIFSKVQSRHMPYELALLPIIESGFSPHARSHQRAVGLWQFIPSTAELFDLDRNWWYDARKDVVSSTDAALDYLEKLYKLNNNDWLLALASYNGGIGNVYKAQRKYRKQHDLADEVSPDFWQIRPYLPKETQAYVPKLLAVAHMIEQAEAYELELAPIANSPYFTVVELKQQVALNQVASLSKTSMDLLETLNPGYHQMATPPTGPFSVVLPVDNAKRLRNQLQSNPQIYAVQWQKYKIRSGDSLSVIAQKFQTSSQAIMQLNGMKNKSIRAGKTLLIPIPAEVVDSVNQQLAKNTTPAKPSKQNQKTPPHWHIVKSGDTIFDLAKYYNVTAATLCEWNNISIKTPLQLGQKLAIYKDHYGQQVEHTVQAGENLWVIAKQYGVTGRDISGWNNLSRNKALQPGQTLTIWSKNLPSRHVVKSGDNLWLIAKANRVSAQKLAEFNELSVNKPLQPGQVILIPVDDEQS